MVGWGDIGHNPMSQLVLSVFEKNCSIMRESILRRLKQCTCGQATVSSLLGVKAKFNLKCWYELVMTHYKYTLITYTVWLLAKLAAVPFYSSLTRMTEFSQWLMVRGPMLQEYVCMSVALITLQCYHNGIIHKIIYNHIWFTKYFYCNKKMNKFKISHFIL